MPARLVVRPSQGARREVTLDADVITKSARYVLDTRRYLRPGPNVEYL